MAFGRILTLLGLIGSFYTLCAAIVAKVPAQEAIDPQLPSRLESDGEGSNATFSNAFVDPFDFNISADTSVVSIATARLWRFIDVFKRQNCQNGENYCFPGSDQSYCECDQICCTNTVASTGWCCATGVECVPEANTCKYPT